MSFLSLTSLHRVVVTATTIIFAAAKDLGGPRKEFLCDVLKQLNDAVVENHVLKPGRDLRLYFCLGFIMGNHHTTISIHYSCHHYDYAYDLFMI